VSGGAQHCPTCGKAPNPVNFGGMCDPCNGKRKARLERTRTLLTTHGQQNTQLGHALGISDAARAKR
jgi:hypothetical protein